MLPNAVAAAYNFPKGRSLEQQCVAIIELGGGFDPKTVYSYCDKHGIVRPELHVMCVDGAKNIQVGRGGADGEVCLDIDVIAMAAPGVKILVIFVPNSDQGFIDGVMAAINHPLKPCAISISWGAAMDYWSTKSRCEMDVAIAKAKEKGIMTFTASGDAGSKDGTDRATVDYPSCSPEAIAVGGTRLLLFKTGRVKFEKAWTLSDGNGSTGGGVAICYYPPVYQNNHQLEGVMKGRMTPDVAANADPVTGYDIDINGMASRSGGTSAGAPLYTALCALINSRLGKPVSNWHDVLYNYTPSVCRDVVGGNNGDYDCVKGFDLCTGLGVVHGERLLEALSKTNGLPVLDPVEAKPGITMPEVSVSWWTKLIEGLKGLTGNKQPAFAVKHIRYRRVQ